MCHSVVHILVYLSITTVQTPIFLVSDIKYDFNELSCFIEVCSCRCDFSLSPICCCPYFCFSSIYQFMLCFANGFFSLVFRCLLLLLLAINYRLVRDYLFCRPLPFHMDSNLTIFNVSKLRMNFVFVSLLSLFPFVFYSTFYCRVMIDKIGAALNMCYFCLYSNGKFITQMIKIQKLFVIIY